MGFKISGSRPSNDLQKIADYFLCISSEAGKPISNKKLQKLVYYAQAWSLVFTNNKLFDDPIEAWLHGPAIRSLWQKYKDYGYLPIQKKTYKPALTSDDERSLLDEVWRVYGKHDADYLEALTHSEEPWLSARQGLDSNEMSATEIDPSVMKEYYALLKKKQVE